MGCARVYVCACLREGEGGKLWEGLDMQRTDSGGPPGLSGRGVEVSVCLVSETAPGEKVVSSGPVSTLVTGVGQAPQR